MKKIAVVISMVIVATLSFVSAQKSKVEIPVNGSLELDYSNFEMYQLTLKNNMSKGVEVKVVNKETGDFVRGFGLGPVGKVEVMVENTSKIVFTNTGDKMASLSLTVKEVDAKKVQNANQGLLSFTLVNSSSESIPLLIPNVMNPNLSPNSKSGVDLKIGQEILFRYQGKRYVLLTVDEQIKEGDAIDVYQLLREKKMELGLK